MTSPGLAERSLLLHGLGLTNLAVARAAVAHGVAVVASDDSSPDSASTLDLRMHEQAIQAEIQALKQQIKLGTLFDALGLE